jgi:hypothetical protein
MQAQHSLPPTLSVMDEFSRLIISRSTIESVSKQEIGNLMIGFSWRKNLWRQPAKLIQVGLIQLIGASIIFAVTMLPVDRVLNPRRLALPQITKIQRLVLANGGIMLVLLGGANWWVIQRGKRFNRLIQLVDRIENYNLIVSRIATIAKISNLAKPNIESNETATVINLLNQTRQNLLTALEIDLHLRQHPESTELSISIAHNLLDLEHLAQQPQFAEYNTLLSQAWEIGMSVYQETNYSRDT